MTFSGRQGLWWNGLTDCVVDERLNINRVYRSGVVSQTDCFVYCEFRDLVCTFAMSMILIFAPKSCYLDANFIIVINVD